MNWIGLITDLCNKCDPIQVLLMVVIAWLMVVISWMLRQNGALQRELFHFASDMSKLTTLLEGLVYGHRDHKANE